MHQQPQIITVGPHTDRQEQPIILSHPGAVPIQQHPGAVLIAYPPIQPVQYAGAPPMAYPAAVQMPYPSVPMTQAPPKQTPMEVLQAMEGAWISQKPQYLESFGPCEFENKYRVYGTKSKGENLKKDKHDKVFKCKERSTCCQRHCVAASMREFNMIVSHHDYVFNSRKNKHVSKWIPFLSLKRDYSCTCMCLNRPIIDVECVYRGAKKKIGHIVDTFKCCDYSFLLYEEKSPDPCYRVNASCCQCGFMFHLPYGPCKEILFDIIDIKAGEAKVGEMKKVWGGCAKELLSNADSYSVSFPKKQTWEQRALLLACVLFVDYRYFEEREEDKNDISLGNQE